MMVLDVHGLLQSRLHVVRDGTSVQYERSFELAVERPSEVALHPRVIVIQRLRRQEVSPRGSTPAGTIEDEGVHVFELDIAYSVVSRRTAMSSNIDR